MWFGSKARRAQRDEMLTDFEVFCLGQSVRVNLAGHEYTEVSWPGRVVADSRRELELVEVRR